MALATLSIDLEAKIAKLEESMSRAERIAGKSASEVAARWEKAGSVAMGAFSALAAGVSVAGLAAIARSSINAIDALNDVADATGSSVENISALEDVALRTGASLDTVESSLIKFNALLKEAKPGSGAEQTLKAIGLSADELRRLDPAEALKKTADALAGYADDGDKARVVQELFGKSVKEVAPFLKDLADAGQLNATVTKAQADEAEKFNKQMAQLSASTQAVSRAIASSLVPGINRGIERFTVAQKAFGGFWGAAFRNDVFSNGDFGNYVEGLQKYMGDLEKLQAKSLDLQEQASKGGYFQQYTQIELNQNEKRIEFVKKQIEFYKLLTRTKDESAGGGRGFVNPNNVDLPTIGPLPDQAKGPRAMVSEYDKLISRIREKTALQALEATQESALTESQRISVDLQQAIEAGTLKLTSGQRAKVDALIAELAAQEKLKASRVEAVRIIEDGMKAADAAIKSSQLQASSYEQQTAAMRAATEEIGLQAAALADLHEARLLDQAAAKDRLADTMNEAGESPQLVDSYRRQAAALRDLARAGREQASARSRDADRQTVKGVLGGTQQGQINALTEQYGALDRALKAGDLSSREYADALDALDEKFANITRPIAEASDKIDAFADQAQRNIQTALGGTFERLFSGEFDSIGELWNDTLKKMAAQAAANFVVSQLFGKGTALAGLFGQANGGAWDGGVQLFARGDVFGSPTAFGFSGGIGVLGEAGPEAVMPLRRGADGKLGVAAAGAAPALNLTINNTVGDLVTSTQLAQWSERTRQAAMAGVMDAQRRVLR